MLKFDSTRLGRLRTRAWFGSLFHVDRRHEETRAPKLGSFVLTPLGRSRLSSSRPGTAGGDKILSGFIPEVEPLVSMRFPLSNEERVDHDTEASVKRD